MKKSFIFPEELAAKICVLPADERILAYDHIIKLSLIHIYQSLLLRQCKGRFDGVVKEVSYNNAEVNIQMCIRDRVYGTAILMQAMIFKNISSDMPLSNTFGSMSSALLILGTLIV